MRRIIVYLLFDYILFPKTPSRRIAVHILFWIVFISSHLLFFLPNALRGNLTDFMVYAYILYYGKFLFIFYSCLLLLRLMRRYIDILIVIPVLFLLCIGITYLFNMVIFAIADILMGLENTTVNFEMLGRTLLTGANADWITKVSIVTFSLQDTQLLILPVGIKMVKFGMKFQKELQDIEMEKVKDELQRLKYQLGPHFILSSLSSLYFDLKTVNIESAQYLARLTDLIQYSIYDTEHDLIALEREIHCFKTFLDLESGRQHCRLRLSIEQTGLIKPTDRIPSMLLLTLAENAFKHGARNDRAPATLDVRIDVEGGRLNFFIENTKNTFKVTSDDEHSGIGLKNITSQLKLYFGSNFTFNINENEKLFAVNMSIPLDSTGPIRTFRT
ncbi:hypothetical protein DSL64_16035 [Dyadobacter luteus]|uniref:Signal transduction histidine kinase internal region domain-containing protein n=1 Tax=Dyadobacter luteus TaxID=2259619 RepID=A0A3D8YCZ6_9BACT|nr:histidine kinase [Dyadobacter luteus]REA60181.1 hypothetical protein DSL64_16035 [Dyadobacter luteus]